MSRFLKVILNSLILLFVEVRQLKDRQISKKSSLDVKLRAQPLKIAQIRGFRKFWGLETPKKLCDGV